ncbi:hypothetical protein TNCV_1097761 [Trichonephila clavipes]|nr:hypothetical protein TNCV_1097761 [Trichonephila clavipes]
MSDQGPRNSSRLRARCTPVVNCSYEHHTDDRYLILGLEDVAFSRMHAELDSSAKSLLREFLILFIWENNDSQEQVVSGNSSRPSGVLTSLSRVSFCQPFETSRLLKRRRKSEVNQVL